MTDSAVRRLRIRYLELLGPRWESLMGTLVLVVVGAALALGSLFMVIHFQRRREEARAGTNARLAGRPRVTRPRNPFAAVSIRPDMSSPCEAVLKIQAQRFLAVKAPRLPLPGCNRENCDCRYIRYDDRRVPGDRRDHFGSYGGLLPRSGEERRADERRKTPAA